MQRPLKAYLKQGRLADVLALIQVLALDKSAHRSEAGIQEELQGVPASASEWRELAREHPEFFRVRQRGDHVVSLTARHVLPREEDRPPQLPPEFVHKLMETAIELHDRELKRSEKWNYLIPAIVAAITSVIIVLVGAYLHR